MRRFNSNFSSGDFELTLAKRELIQKGDYNEYISKLFDKSSRNLVINKTPVEPGVVYRSEPRTYILEETEYTQSLEVLGFQHICCLDWDWPNEGHKTDLCVTIKTYKDVQRRLKRHGETWRTYITPGGVRAFCVSKAYHPENMPKLDADPLYMELCKKTSVFWVRVVAKAERSYDWVAEYQETIGNAPIDPNLAKLVEVYHDTQIQINRGYEKINDTQQEMIEANLG